VSGIGSPSAEEVNGVGSCWQQSGARSVGVMAVPNRHFQPDEKHSATESTYIFFVVPASLDQAAVVVGGGLHYASEHD